MKEQGPDTNKSNQKESNPVPSDYKSLMKAREEGLIVQSEREYREEQYRVAENQIRRRQEMYEKFYGSFATQKERIAFYSLLDHKYRRGQDNGLYPEDVRDKMRYVRELIHELRDLGVSEESIYELTRPERTLSRLVITSDYRIFLPEYNHAEVMLRPLPKAVFLLFLRHPEGIVLKEMGDYFVELLSIYKAIMGSKYREAKARASLLRICNPLDNSLHEKISRINEALRKLIDETIVMNYFIQGKRCEARQILLPQSLISWESA